MRLAARRVPPKSTEEIAREWDTMAAIRDEQILSGTDISFGQVIVPALISLLPRQVRRLIDVGCGTGVLTNELLPIATQVVGIDPSSASIERAKSRVVSDAAQFVVATVEEYADGQSESFDAAVANMSLMTAADLRAVTRSIGNLLEDRGCFVFSITHPWFWPSYWGYADAPWFQYESEIFIEAPFRVSKDDTGVITTHIHRPLEMYSARLTEAGLTVDAIVEPMPSADVERLYPKSWEFPRFLLLRAVKR